MKNKILAHSLIVLLRLLSIMYTVIMVLIILIVSIPLLIVGCFTALGYYLWYGSTIKETHFTEYGVQSFFDLISLPTGLFADIMSEPLNWIRKVINKIELRLE